MGRTYRGEDRERFRKQNKKWKRALREERQKKRSVQDDRVSNEPNKFSRETNDDEEARYDF